MFYTLMFLLTLAGIFAGMAIYLHKQEKAFRPTKNSNGTSTRLRPTTSTKLRPATSTKLRPTASPNPLNNFSNNSTVNEKKLKTKHEAKMVKQAKELHKKKNPRAAAQILESIGMEREALQILEKSREYEEAGKLAYRNGMPKRAGRIFAKIKKWEFAAASFKQAEMFEEAGQCYHELGDYNLALECFKKTENFNAISKCYEILKEFRKAAMTYLKFKKVGKAVPLYQRMYQENPDRWAKTQFAPEELKAFATWIKAGNPDLAFAWTLYYAKKLPQLILDLAEDGDIELASKIFVKDPNEFDNALASQLVAEVRYETAQASNLVTIFNSLGHHYHEGIVLEKLERFKEAADAFKQSGEVSRAVHCFQRAGLPDEAKELESNEANAQKVHSEKIAAHKEKIAGASADFSLEGITNMGDVKPAANSQAFEIEENTKLLPDEKAGINNSPLIPNAVEPPKLGDQFLQEPEKTPTHEPKEVMESEQPPIPKQEQASTYEPADLFSSATSKPAEAANATSDIQANDLFSPAPTSPAEKSSPAPEFQTNDLFSNANSNPAEQSSPAPEFQTNDLFSNANSNPAEQSSPAPEFQTNDLFNNSNSIPGGQNSSSLGIDPMKSTPPLPSAESNLNQGSQNQATQPEQVNLDLSEQANSHQAGQFDFDQATLINLDQEDDPKQSLPDQDQTLITSSPVQKLEFANSEELPKLADSKEQELKTGEKAPLQEALNPDPLSDIFSSFGGDSTSKDLAKSNISEQEKQAFHACWLFNKISTEFIDKIWQQGHTERLKKNDSILTLQDHPLGVYIILSGTVVCESEGDRAKQRRLVATESFGESSVFASNIAGATYTAVEDSLILKINATKFKSLMQEDYLMAVQLFTNYTDRLLAPAIISEFVQKNQDNS